MRKLLAAFLLVGAGMGACVSSHAACEDLYPKHIQVQGTTELCNSFYASLYDVEHQRVILVSEHLTGNIGTAERVNHFHSDTRVGRKPSPAQYEGTGYDKGHMAPAGDSSNPAEMEETFLITNMTPQKPTCNRDGWRMLEESVRKSYRGNLFVITTAVYKGQSNMNGIPIPSGYFKVIYTKPLQFFYTDNVDHCKIRTSNPTEFREKMGFNL